MHDVEAFAISEHRGDQFDAYASSRAEPTGA